MTLSINKIIDSLLAILGERQQEIVRQRYGLNERGEEKTLAALGDRYHITRERVRQIQNAALAALETAISKDPNWKSILNRCRKQLVDAGGVLKKDVFLQTLSSFLSGINHNQLNLMADASKAFYIHPADKNFYSFVYADKQSLQTASDFIDQWTNFLRNRKTEVLSGKYHSLLNSFIEHRKLKEEWVTNYLAISKKVSRNPYGDVGLTEWAEISPRTIRDRVYLVLKKKRTPLHFETIAQLVNSVFQDLRPASPPTVHNELIKDQRFVLVGRGIYGLREHGYEPGTALEVIRRILKKSGPLRPRDIILAVQKERFFKPNTILVNLQNKTHFVRRADGAYEVRKA